MKKTAIANHGSSLGGAVREIEVGRLVLSPDETRKTIDQAAIEGLAQSIAKNGVIEPLLVRKVGGDAGPFEIVAGQRRWLALKLAAINLAPCVVREMTDAEAAEIRVISNLQREDLPPLEEALAFASLLDAPGATVETVAAKLAKSASYIGRRLQLLKAIEPVREALKAGAIEMGHALELARLGEKQQMRHLAELNCGYVCSKSELALFDEEDRGELEEPAFDDGDDLADEDDESDSERPAAQVPSEWRPTNVTVAMLRSSVARTTLRVLTDAPFPLDDELPPMACAECPKRSGNAALLFDDCAQNTCTDRECFDAKVEFWIEHELERAKEQQRKLLRLAYHWTSDKRAVYIQSYNGVHLFESERECPHGEEGIWIDGPKAGHRATICRKAECKTHQGGKKRSRAEESWPKPTAARRKLLAKLNAEKKYRAALFKAVAAAPIPAAHAEDRLNLEVCLYAVGRAPGQYNKKTAEALGWPEKVFSWDGEKSLRETLLKLTAPERLRAAVVAAHSGEIGEIGEIQYASTSKAAGLERLAAILGLDVKKIRAGSATPEKTAPGKTANKPAVKPAKKPATKSAPQKTRKKGAKKGGRK